MSDAAETEWLLFVAQLPAAPSSARVAMWRRLKAAGATSLLTGCWVLPSTHDHRGLLGELAGIVQGHGGSAAVFAARAVEGISADQIVGSFASDRAREYDEFATRADGLHAEIDRETHAEKFSFAELEELEHDLDKLRLWLAKIVARDFFPAKRHNKAVDLLETCELALRVFAETVYARDGASDAGSA